MSVTAGISQGALNNAHAKFGDASQNLIAQIMQGTSYDSHRIDGLNIMVGDLMLNDL